MLASVRMVGKNLAVKDIRKVSQGLHTLFLFFYLFPSCLESHFVCGCKVKNN
jgi:hypothetical protein